MKKKRIILLIIAVIIIALGIKGLLMYNNRQYIGGNGLQHLDEQSSPPRENVDNKDKYDKEMSEKEKKEIQAALAKNTPVEVEIGE